MRRYKNLVDSSNADRTVATSSASKKPYEFLHKEKQQLKIELVDDIRDNLSKFTVTICYCWWKLTLVWALPRQQWQVFCGG